MKSRISIDVTPEEHRKLKALAALQGKSIKEFVLESTLGARSSDTSLAELEDVLRQRLEEAAAGPKSTRTVADVFRAAREASGDVPEG